VDHATGQAVPNPDPAAGLYVVDRNDQCQHVQIPMDCLAVQIGECTQIVTGGAVVATPHCVKGATVPNVARISLPCFVDTPPGFSLKPPPGSSRQDVIAAGLQSRRVPPLESRWTGEGMTFGEFLQATFSLYYNWSQEDS
jgi:isopenicillin N synthase-like dioxygenase